MDWQPIETAPKDGTAFLIAKPNATFFKVAVVRYRSGGGRLVYSQRGGVEWHPKWWMPLPTLPAKEAG